MRETRTVRYKSQDLRDLFEQSITVRHLAQRLEACPFDADTDAVRALMDSRDYDVIGIRDEQGEVYGYVERTMLQNGRCGDYRQVFHPSDLVAESTPLIHVLPLLRHRRRVFVLERNQVSGIVTRGDLQKAPVRMLLFGLVTLLEAHLLRLVRLYYPDGAWQAALTENRLDAARRVLEERKSRNEAIDLADCLQFADKRHLLFKLPDVNDLLGLTAFGMSRTQTRELLERAEQLRNRLAHSQDIVGGTTWGGAFQVRGKQVE